MASAWTMAVIGIFCLGVAASNAMNLYCGVLCTLTIGQTFRPSWLPHAKTRTIAAVLIFTLALLPYEAYYSLDAILRSSARMLTRRGLLEWTTAREADNARRSGLLACRHFPGLVGSGDTIAVVADVVGRQR